MSTALVVLAHPSPGSLNHAVAAAIERGFRDSGLDVRMHDLYQEGFDPLLSAAELDVTRSPVEIYAGTDDPLVREHRDHLSDASVLAIVHPNWWGKPPAMMSGWIDRVLVPGVAYELDDPVGLPTTLLNLRSLYVVNTSDTTAERELALFGDPLRTIWQRCIGSFLGEPPFERRVLRTVSDSDAGARREWLDEVAADAHRIGESARAAYGG